MEEQAISFVHRNDLMVPLFAYSKVSLSAARVHVREDSRNKTPGKHQVSTPLQFIAKL